MNTVFELALWSRPGANLHEEHGNELKSIIDRELDLRDDIFMGLSFIPCDTDSKNLSVALSEGELAAKDFDTFCRGNDLVPTLNNPESAARFLEFSYGRELAWLHIPHNAEGLRILRSLQKWAASENYNVQSGNELYCVIHDADEVPLNW